MSDTKPCPKCQKQMHPANDAYTIPVAIESLPTSSRGGLTLAPYRCPHCHYVEFYSRDPK
jgi:hypothetical protein